MATPMQKITYEDKSNPIAVVDRPTQATAEDFNEIKEVVNSLCDRADTVGTPNHVYIAFASDDQGTDFTMTFHEELHYMAISCGVELEAPEAADFAGLWRFIMPEAPKDNTPYVRQNGAWIELPGLKQLVYTIQLPIGDVAERAAGAVGGEGMELWAYAAAANPNDLEITHNLGRKFASVSVSYVDDGEQVLLMGNLGYTGISAPSNDVLIIKGLSTKAFPLIIQITFA